MLNITRTINCILLSICFVLLSCVSWQNMTSPQKVRVCQDTLKVIVKPECQRLAKKGQKYVDLCEAAVEDAVAGCAAAVLKDGSLMCDRISAKADQCQLIPDDSEDHKMNVTTCERVVRGAGLLCTLVFPSQEENPVDSVE